jgi:hypothetical protein
MMATDAELRNAMEAGAKFKQAILDVSYDRERDQLVLSTPWGSRVVNRKAIEEFRDVPAAAMTAVYASQVGIHVDALDIDINSAGLLADLFPEWRSNLSDSF